jgi:ABC-type phosphate/phosphonate transport system substrate-binding protein
MRRNVLISLAIIMAVLASTQALAGPRDIVIHVARLGGDRASAQPYVDRFLRTLETALGWPASSSSGAFVITRKAALEYISTARPGLGMLDPPLYFELRQARGLTPLLQLDSPDLVTPRLHVVVKDPGLKGLADLKGKRLWSLLADYPQYLARVVLAGQLEARDLNLKQIGQALKGVRGVLRGDCEATLLDDEQLARAREISGGHELRVIHTSPALPPIPLVVFGDGPGAGERQALMQALLRLCGDGGAAICKEMHVGRFVPVDTARFDDAQKRYGE